MIRARTIMEGDDVDAAVGPLRTDRESIVDVCIVRTAVCVRAVRRRMLVQSRNALGRGACGVAREVHRLPVSSLS